jgi:collagen type I/II/III/V/XI/XXIV/XXVII alpha
VGTADPERADAGSPAQLLRTAATLRWTRPDLTAALAEAALETATDVDTWAEAAGWLLHGRAALGDGRDTACDLLGGLARAETAGSEPAAGPPGDRLRIELGGAARRAGQRDVARALLSGPAHADDAGLRADAVTELARCAVDEATATADDALRVAEEAWQAAGCPHGAASVLLLRAGRDRQGGRAETAAACAVRGLGLVVDGGRGCRASASVHLAAALTAEWTAALVTAGRVEQARAQALPAARRLLATARPSRQVAGLRLAVARVVAVTGGPEGVVADVEPAAEDAAHSDVPELESACRLLLGELYEAAGRLDAALASVRAAMAAQRRDRDRELRLRAHLAALGAGRPGPPSLVGSVSPPVSSPPAASVPRQLSGPSAIDAGERADRKRHRRPDPPAAFDGLGMGELLAGALAAYRGL